MGSPTSREEREKWGIQTWAIRRWRMDDGGRDIRKTALSS